VVAAHLGALSTQNDPQARLTLKLSLAKKLFKRGFDKDQVVKLYKFIDWILALPEELEIKYNESIQQLVEEKSIMNYVTSGERIATKRGFEQGLLQGIEKGIEKGIERGKQDGERYLLSRQLQRKFSVIPERYLQLLAQADADRLLIWGERVVEASTLEEVFSEP
jgi:flagellar biosynthesis/type III secretory pathway protein FliH